MWSRKELKEKSKERMKLNYWKCVLVALIVLIVVDGVQITRKYSANDLPLKPVNKIEISKEYDMNDLHDHDYATEHGYVNPFDSQSIKDHDFDSKEEALAYAKEARNLLIDRFERVSPTLIALSGTALLVFAAIGICIRIFVVNVINVGGKQFFRKNLYEKADFGELGSAFQSNYIETVKTMFFRDLYVFLWSLLFVIPGIIKMYEYRMVPYLCKAYPELTTEEILAKSKQMMNGQKWDAFVLDLSFIGWHILNVITFNILGIFYVNPYVNQTYAALFDALDHRTTPETQGYENYVEME